LEHLYYLTLVADESNRTLVQTKLTTAGGIGRRADYKPNSVPRSFDPGGNHSSRLWISPKLKRPTRKPGRAVPGAANGATFPIWPCSVWGLPSRSVTGPLVRSYRTFSPLPGNRCQR